MTLTCIDFETHDPLLKQYGSGSTFKYHYDEINFQVLGCGIKTPDEEVYLDFTKDYGATNKLSKYLQNCTTLVMHNAAYDLGCLKYLYTDCRDIERHLPEVRDTMLMAKLHTQQYNSYSLDFLAKEYKCVSQKNSDLLHDYAWSSGTYQSRHKELTGRNCHTRPSDTAMDSFCKTNMKLFPAEVVGEYCLEDVRATWDLYHKLLPSLDCYDLSTVSKIIKICLKAKFKGVRLDLVATRRLSKQWKELALKAKDDFMSQIVGYIQDDFNINSGEQVGSVLEQMGIVVPKTIKGNYSLTKDWLEEQGSPLLDQLKLYRKANKAEKDFIQKILQYQEIIPEKYRRKNIGIMFPSLKPLGATLTGRFSSGGGTGSKELNILAISGRDEHFGMPLRELFLPHHENEQVICADFSNQEPRLQVHYAKLLNCDGVDEIIVAWHDNPKMKYHQKVADMTKLEYDVAKMLTLALSYGMGVAKMAARLNVTFPVAKRIVEQYHQLLPFMRQLQKRTAAALKQNGYIKTIGGRKLTIDEPYEYMGEMKTNEHKAMSKLIQGSGLDQLWQAMIRIDEAGLDFMLCVHDEVIISSAQPAIDNVALVRCMEDAIPLLVPVVAEVGIGDNWLRAKP